LVLVLKKSQNPREVKLLLFIAQITINSVLILMNANGKFSIQKLKILVVGKQFGV
jgi:hypothetical protein